MNVTVVYESMFGNTRRIAERIAQGIRTPLAGRPHRVIVRHVSAVTVEEAARADVLVVGAPTHANGLPRPTTRAEAARWAADPVADLSLEAPALGAGVGEWLEALPSGDGLFATFDTRADLARRLSGFASRGIAERLEATGRLSVLEPTSFMVTTTSHPEAQELARASTWGEMIAHAVTAAERLALSESAAHDADDDDVDRLAGFGAGGVAAFAPDVSAEAGEGVDGGLLTPRPIG